MTTWYINVDSGNDSNAGTSGSPFKTVAKGVSSASAGDIIYCQNCVAVYPITSIGVYTALTFIGQSYGGVVWDFGGAGSYALILGSAVASIYSFNNIIIQNVSITGDGGGVIDTTSNVTVSFNSSGFKSIFLHNNGLFFGTGTISLIGCLFSGLNSDSVFAGLFYETTAPVLMKNCTLYVPSGNSFTSIGYSTTSTITMKNNIFYAYTSQPFNAWGSPTYAGSNNLFYNFTTIPSLANQLTSDPLFVNGPAGNFNLQANSPARKAGIYP